MKDQWKRSVEKMQRSFQLWVINWKANSLTWSGWGVSPCHLTNCQIVTKPGRAWVPPSFAWLTSIRCKPLGPWGVQRAPVFGYGALNNFSIETQMVLLKTSMGKMWQRRKEAMLAWIEHSMVALFPHYQICDCCCQRQLSNIDACFSFQPVKL